MKMSIIDCPYCESDRFDIVEKRVVDCVSLCWDINGRIVTDKIDGTLKFPSMTYVCRNCGSDYMEADFQEVKSN